MKYASVVYRDYAENSLFTPGVGENNGSSTYPTASCGSASWPRASS
jgi:hypothetical protein